MAKMLRSYEDWKKSDNVMLVGKGCACSCLPDENGEARFDTAAETGGCACAPGDEDNIND